MDEEIKSNILSPAIWLRLLLMLVFSICAWVALWVVGFVAAGQFLFALVGGKPNQHLGHFAAGLLAYISQLLEYVTFGSDVRPFPFAPFPGMEAASSKSGAKASAKKKAPARRKKAAPAKSEAAKTEGSGDNTGS